MAVRTHFAQKSFAQGELTPRLDARDDIKRYGAGLALLVNGVVRVQGGVERRPGTRYVAETKFSDKDCHLVEFVYSDQQAYTLEFGDQYVRFFTQGGVLLDVTNFVTNGTFDADTASWTDASTGGSVIAWNAGGGNGYLDLVGAEGGVAIAKQEVTVTQANVKHRIVFTVKAGGSATLRIGSSDGGQEYHADTVYAPGTYSVAFTPTGTAVHVQFRHSGEGSRGIDTVSVFRYAYEIVSPYSDVDLQDLNFTQSADTLFLAHPNYEPRRLDRLGATNWAFTTLTLVDGPYLDPNLDSTKTLTPSVTTGNGTLTATGHTPFTANHVGSYWRITHGGTTGYVKVTSFTSSTVVNITVQKTLGGTTATANWSEGAFSAERGYPRVVQLHEDRLWFGGTKFKPQTTWSSKTSNWLDFTPGANPSDPIAATIASNKVNVIKWIIPSRVLLVGTTGDEFALASVGTGAIQPNSIQVRKQTSYGSAGHQGSVSTTGNSVIFVQASQRRLRELSYDFNTDAYVARDLSLLAEHLFRFNQLVEVAVQRDPDQIVWCVRSDGALLGLTYDRVEDVVGWHRHFTDGFFERIAVIPHPSGTRDQVWVVVNRTIQGQTKRYVEVLEDEAGYYDLFHADSALQYVGAPVSAVAGLDHLIGETVVILGDGAVHPPQVVASDGSVSLQTAASVIEVGLPYSTTVSPMRPVVDLPDGSSHDRKRRWGRVSIRVIDTLGGAINGEPIDYRFPADPMDEATPLFTGIKAANKIGWDRDGFVVITQDQPLPMEILAIHGVLVVED